MSDRDSTPKPGKIISSTNAKLVIEMFISEFQSQMNSAFPSNVPMACKLDGVAILDDFSNLPISNDSKVFALYENTDELFLTTIKAMIHYLKNREPWEDCDICIFDSSYNWCFAISHEDRFAWVTKE